MACEDGIEPSGLCSKFSVETIISILQSFLSTLSAKKGFERNLFTKRFIKEIIYSKENIKINLFYSENFNNFSYNPAFTLFALRINSSLIASAFSLESPGNLPSGSLLPNPPRSPPPPNTPV